MTTLHSPLYLDIGSAAAVLGLTERAVRARVARRQLPFRKLGDRILIPRAELEQYMRALEGVTAAEAIKNVSVNG